MELIVRAVDVGSGNTKFVTGVAGAEIRCASFPSIAYPSSGETPAWPATERRKTVCIPVGPLYYEVGPDVGLAADTFRAKQLHDEYTESPEYMALLRGALSMMKVPHVDLLVVGLPVALLTLKKASLEKAMVGSHQVGGGKVITVHKALAVAQPQGALVHYAAEHEKMSTIGNEQSLVIDPGSRTFDWLVCRGMRLVQKQSHSINRGISDVLRLLAAEISKDIGTPYRDTDLAPANLTYDRSSRTYVATEQFRPLFPRSSARRYLAELLATKTGLLESGASFIGSAPEADAAPSPWRALDERTVEALVKAIRGRLAVTVSYQSMSSIEATFRQLSPHALGYDGFRWHVRAYCHKRERFSDFVLARILGLDGFEPSSVDPRLDTQWHTVLTLVLAPHPKLTAAKKRVLELDYGMQDGEVKLACRHAFLYYTLRRLGLHTTEPSDPVAQQITLKNRDELQPYIDDVGASA